MDNFVVYCVGFVITLAIMVVTFLLDWIVNGMSSVPFSLGVSVVLVSEFA